MMKKYDKIITNVHEIYIKLPMLNYTNEVIFSELVSESSVKSILNKFNKDRINIEMEKIGNKIILTKKGELRFNTYLV
jgi:hypothetical protein